MDCLENKMAKKEKVHITTLGCEKNLVDSEAMVGNLDKERFEIVSEPTDSDIVIVNTCGFIQSAKEESIDAILEAEQLKKDGTIQKVIVTGCMSERYKDDLVTEIEGVDAFFGTEDFAAVAGYLGQSYSESIEKIYSKRNLSGPTHFAYLKISEGCDHECSFCAIPGMRGKHRSRSIASLVSEASMLAANGAKELILIAQDSTYWGRDLGEKQDITHLLSALEAIAGIEWIRIMYLYPNTIPKSFAAYLAGSNKVLPYIDIPLQHASANMLKLMNRGGNRKYLEGVIRHLRENIPNLVVRTTFIVGHPGETDADFNELLAFIKDMRFNRVGAFRYSEEDGTPSASLRNKVSPAQAQERYNALMAAQQDISLTQNEAMTGKRFKVLIDRYDEKGKILTGRTYADAPEIDNEVIFENIENGESLVGKFVEADIKSAAEYELFAILSQ
jgi:ribosomal protein S12 methylthiotransferase